MPRFDGWESDGAGLALAACLRALGCSVQFEHGVWWRCLVTEPADADGACTTWIGEGATEYGAMAGAFAQMVPSAAARRLLLRGSAPHAPPPIELPAPQPAEPARAPTLEPVIASAPEPLPPVVAPQPTLAAAAEPPRPAAERLDLDEALDILAQQRDDIRAASRELGEIAPRRLRLLLLHWMARARAVQEQLPGEREVHEAVHFIANMIQKVAFDLWPGSVPALQISARPAECKASVGGDAESPISLRNWADVARAAETALERMESEAIFDADGWADSAALQPPPMAPDGLLREQCSRLTKLAADWERPKCVPSREQMLGDGALRGALTDLARKLRWLRGGVEDVASWSAAIGHLRRISYYSERDCPDLARALHEEYTPAAGSWAKELGQNPAEKLRRRAKRELLQRLPRSGSANLGIVAWLKEAFNVFDNPDLAYHLRDRADAVAAVAAEEMDDARTRKRLRRLQETLAGPRDAVREAAVAKEAELTERVDAEEPRQGAAAALDPREALRQKVLRATRGRRILFVSNRADPPLERDVREGLEPVRLDWLVAEDRRVAAAAQRIASGTYHVVLCVTGFISHSTERSLRTACIPARVPYVRVFKGRFVSCLRAIERDLGLTEPAEPQTFGLPATH